MATNFAVAHGVLELLEERPTGTHKLRQASSRLPTRIHEMELADTRRKHHDLSAEGRALVEVDDVLVDHANATGRDASADGPGLVRAMDSVKGIFVALPEIHGSGAQWIARTARHANSAPQYAHLFHEVGLTLDHFLGRIPVRPFLLVTDGRHAGPTEALPPHADPLTERPSAPQYKVKEAILRVDDDCAGRFIGGVINGLP
jgi:hypothetical protein